MSMISELVKELRNEAQEVRLCSNECESAELLDRAADTIEMLSEKVRTDRPSAVDLSSVYSTAYRSGYEKGKADRPQGEWIEHKGRTIVRDNNFIDFFPTEYECSNCGLRQSTYFINSTLPNFCPNCGARMKGADDE